MFPKKQQNPRRCFLFIIYVILYTVMVCWCESRVEGGKDQFSRDKTQPAHHAAHTSPSLGNKNHQMGYYVGT